MPLDRSQWDRIQELFERGLELDESERSDWLRGETEDAALRAEVESLWAADRRGGASTAVPQVVVRSGGTRVPAPSRLGPYTLLREAGRGGMSTVFVAQREEVFDRLVAIKVIRTSLESEALRARFRSERQILAQLEHPNIARLYDGGTSEDGSPYLVMELVDGEPIDSYCDDRALSLAARLRLVREVCVAVEYAHRQLVVHRDIKPDNILVTAGGEIKLLDFGVAKLLPGEGEKATVTQFGLRALTPGFASPEQLQEAPISTASDVYSLGAVLYRLLTGELPGADTVPGRLREVVEGAQPRRPSVVAGLEPAAARALAGDVDAIVLNCLRQDPEDRYPSVSELIADIDRFLGGWPVVARQGSTLHRLAKFVKRRRWPVAAGLALAVAVAVVFGNTIYQSRRVAAERDKLRAVSDYLVDVFKVSSPDREIGASVSAQELLDAGAKRIADSFGGDPAGESEMLQTMGRVYSNLGLFDRAAELHERAATLSSTLAVETAARARGLLHWSWALRGTGDFERASALADDAIDLLRDSRSHRPLLAEVLAVRASIREVSGQPHEAEKDYRAALATLGSIGEADDLARAQLLVGLARRLAIDGRPAEAIPYANEALQIQTRELGREHPDVAGTLGALAMIEQKSGSYEKAIVSYQEAIELRSRFLPRDHPDMLRLLSELGSTYGSLGDLERSLDTSREVFELAQSRFAPGHPAVVTYRHNLAANLSSVGRFDEAEPLLRQTLELRQGESSGPSAFVGQAHYSLGTLLVDAGRPVEAEPHFLTSLEILGSFRMPEAALPRLAYARCLVLLGRAEEAEGFARDGLERLRASYPDGHGRVGHAEIVLGAVLLELERFGEARTLLESGHRTVVSLRGTNDPEAERAAEFLERLRQLEEGLAG